MPKQKNNVILFPLLRPISKREQELNAERFGNALARELNIVPNEPMIADGKVHVAHIGKGKSALKNVSYILSEREPCGIFSYKKGKKIYQMIWFGQRPEKWTLSQKQRAFKPLMMTMRKFNNARERRSKNA